MTIQSIIKKAIQRLELEGKILTPDFYAEAFCKEAKKAGMITEDCSHVKKISNTMNTDLQKEVLTYRIKTMQELTRFLISKLNRATPTKATEILDSQSILIKRILQVVEVLHNKEASDLARKSQELLKSMPSASQLEQFKQLWINFLATYDDTFLKSLSIYGDIDTKNLKKSIENLNLHESDLLHLEGDMNLSKLSSLLVASLTPSIASSANETIANVSKKIKKDPSLLDTSSMSDEIKSAISFRIALDKDSVQEMVESISGVLNQLSLRLIDMIDKSDNSSLEIQKIKTELEAYNLTDTTNFKTAHKKLYTIALALEGNTQLFTQDLKIHGGEVDELSLKIKKLEKELEAVKEDLKEDFLTKLYNKRALDEYITLKEAEYKRYGHNFSIIMFDLDNFSDVNDTYGHQAGDAVLSAFAKILKDKAREVDIIGRFGGDEFMVILSGANIQGGIIFAEKIRCHVEKAKFMFKKKRIGITVSSGVSERKKHISVKSTIHASDTYMYRAKDDGQNKVVSK